MRISFLIRTEDSATGSAHTMSDSRQGLRLARTAGREAPKVRGLRRKSDASRVRWTVWTDSGSHGGVTLNARTLQANAVSRAVSAAFPGKAAGAGLAHATDTEGAAAVHSAHTGPADSTSQTIRPATIDV
jgi:hypothetical protein